MDNIVEYNVAPPKWSGIQVPLTETDADALQGTCKEWAQNIKCVLFEPSMIDKKVQALAKAISAHYQHCTPKQPLLVVGLLTGAVIFLSDLMRHLTVPYEVDFMVLSSYGKGTESSGTVRLKKDLSINPNGRDILIVEDLIDTGNTLAWLRSHLLNKQCASVTVCCLLDKSSCRTADVNVNFIGFDCPNEFVVGYGMDFADQYRCLPYIGVLKQSAYKK